MRTRDEHLEELTRLLGADGAAALDRSAELDLLVGDDAAFLARLEPIERSLGPAFVASYGESLRAMLHERTVARAKKYAERSEEGQPWVRTEDIVAVFEKQQDALERLAPGLREELLRELPKYDLASLEDGDLAKELARALGLLR